MGETKFHVSTIFKEFYIQLPVSVFLFLMLHLMLDGLILFHKGDFHHIRSFFKRRYFWQRTSFRGIPT